MHDGRLIRPGWEEPFSLRLIKTLIWVQAAAGVALLLGGFWSVVAGQALVLLGLGVCIVGWILSLRPLADRARRLGRHPVAPLPPYRDLLLILWGTLQFGSVCFDLTGPGASFFFNLAANFFLLLVLVLRGWMSITLKVPMSRPTWYWAMAIAGLGVVIRASLVVMVLLSWRGC